MLLISLAIIAPSSVLHADDWSDRAYQDLPPARGSAPYYPQQSHRQSAGRSANPWALPDTAVPENDYIQDTPAPDQHMAPETPVARPDGDGAGEYIENDWSVRHDRFVTPEILDSIERQQTRMQQTYGADSYPHQNDYRQDRYYSGMPPSAAPLPYAPYGVPSYRSPYGLGGFNPLFDSPMSSPWLTDPGALLRGQSFSYVPDEAIGGIPPMRTPGFGPGGLPGGMSGDLGPGSMQDSGKELLDDMPDEVFNPFTFLHD